MAAPRPRPRPRPVPRAQSSSNNATSSAAPIVVDDDSMFIRNKGRSATAWKKFEQINETTKHKNTHSDSEDESDSPRPKKQTKKTTDSTQAKIQRLMSETLSDDSDSNSDSDIQITGGRSPTKKKGKQRQRSRSRSITPPPQLPRHELQKARDIVRQVLSDPKRISRSPSPVGEADESTDTINLDPELQKILRSAQAHRPRSEPVERGPQETIEITVKWQPHPLETSAQATTTTFKLNRKDNFRELMEAVADDVELLFESLVLSYNGVQLFPSATPASLQLWVEADLDACDKKTWEYMRANPTKAFTPAPAATAMTIADDDDDDDDVVLVVSDTEPSSPGAPHAGRHESDNDDDSDDGGDTFKIVLRSALTTKDITLTVRQTTTCGAIVQAFLKKAGLADQYGKSPRESVGGTSKRGKRGAPPESAKNPQLAIDGDKVAADVPIGEMDLDDGDMVDVVGL